MFCVGAYSPVVTCCWSYHVSCCVVRVTSLVTWATSDTVSLMNRCLHTDGAVCLSSELTACPICNVSKRTYVHAASIVSQCGNGKAGFSSSSPQTPLQEFDYTVTNLATDLRDGLRLTLVCHAKLAF